MKQLWRDFGFGWRILRRKPGFTVAALSSLILGIGLNTAVFTLLDAVFRHPLPVADLDSLVSVYVSRRNDAGEFVARRPHSYPNYRDLRDESRSFSGLAAHFWWPMNFTGGSEPVRTAGMFVSANYFDVLGLQPAHGRFFRSEEDRSPGSHPLVVLSHTCWTRLFGSDPGVLGETVQVNGRDLTVIGVAPRGFHGTVLQADVEFWMPLMMFPELSPFSQFFDQRGVMLFYVFGRLRPGVSPAQAEAETSAFYDSVEAAYAADFVGFERLGAVVRPLAEGVFQDPSPAAFRERHLRYGRRLEVASWGILLIACLSVANLLLVRGLERAREIAIRQSLGAGRSGVFRQLLTENLMLFFCGALLALPAGWLLMRFLWRFRPPELAPGGSFEIELHTGVWLFTFAVALATGLVFGLVPAVRASRADVVAHLKESGAMAGESQRFDLRRGLVVLQLAATLMALIGAGLFLRSLRNAYDIDLGFDAESLLAVGFAPGEQGYDRERREQFYRQVLERARSIPGVRAATLSENRLLRGAMLRRQVFPSGSDQPAISGERDFHRVNAVAPGFFETAGIPLLHGRDFDESMAGDGPAVAIINRTMAETLWPDAVAVGKIFRFDYPDQLPDVEIVGVAADAKYRQVQEERQFFIYLAMAQVLPSQATLHVRTDGDPAALLQSVRREVHELDPALPLTDVRPMRWFVDESLWQEVALARLLTVLGLLALGLATLGIYGVLAQVVAQRRREIGIRMAVGARRGDLLRWVLADGVRLIGLGIAIGLALAVIAARLVPAISAELVEVSAVDPIAYAGAAATLGSVAFLGCLIPARRAAAVDPVRSLREE